MKNFKTNTNKALNNSRKFLRPKIFRSKNNANKIDRKLISYRIMLDY